MSIQYLGKTGRAISTPRASGAASRFGFEVSAADVARVTKKLERASGKSLWVQMQAATVATADLVEKKAKQASPRKTGNLRGSIKSRPEGRGRSKFFGVGGRASSMLVGPMHGRGGPHRHLVIYGHNIVTPGGRSLGRRTRGNPFMDRAKAGVERELRNRMAKEWRHLFR